jgi:DNA-binding transcriptional MerR regulator/lipopolysaccharide biosynthesis regulator YciM
MLGVSERQLRNWERQGLIAATDTFSFSDLIGLRTLQKLRQKRIPPRQIGRALESLRRKLSGVRHPLAELRIVSDGRTIAVQMPGEKMEAISGQLLFNFDTAELGGLRSFPEQPATDAKQAEAWFQRGLALEEAGAPVDEAIAAYRKAIELNPAAAGALVNLGTVYYRLRDFAEAEKCYGQAITVDPGYALALFNLGNLYDERGELPAARGFYIQALRLNPAFADAHFNLALLCEKTGDAMAAVRHWKQYLKLDRSSSWADIARRQLDKLRQATLIRSR